VGIVDPAGIKIFLELRTDTIDSKPLLEYNTGMNEFTKKHPQVDAFIKNLFGKDRQQMIENNLCMMCNNSATEFRDELSEKEYSISGMCQGCQDKVFGGGA
jgi:hypothetical protein